MTIRLNKGHLAAIALFIAMVVWMLLGTLKPEPEFTNPRPLVMNQGLTRVQVERMQGQAMGREITVSARTAANRRVDIRSEVRAKVIAIHRQKGEPVKQGDLILELDARDWPARVKQAEAALKQRQLEAQSAQRLRQQGLANAAELASAQTMLANAEAELTNARLQLDATQIRAPFDGIVDQRSVEVGDFVQDGTALVTVLDFSPYLIKGQVAEIEAGHVNIGDRAYAELVNGDRVEGVIRFIAAEADAQTRTFPIEMEVANPSGNMTSGLTAKLHIPQPETQAYYISPALLILDDEGRLGLKGINEQHQVIFQPINLLKADNSGIWIYGLGERADIITVGQGFVEYGEQVEPVFHSDDSPTQIGEQHTDETNKQTALTAG
ncbi:efflux RND transporter periplasmic adaptor subunit [Bacterioplanes sanyensis]|nr:efflux RND transporter periplasmic adaptor subunit [Bacterioplanes sanyensis]